MPYTTKIMAATDTTHATGPGKFAHIANATTALDVLRAIELGTANATAKEVDDLGVHRAAAQ